MKNLLPFFGLALCLSLPAAADTTKEPVSTPAKNRTPPKEHMSSPASTKTLANIPVHSGTPTPPPTQVPNATPAPSAPAKASATLDAYVADLADKVPLSKDEQTDIKTYYEDDGAKLQAILNDANLSPLQQQEHVDEMRDARNAKIDALLQDVDRQTKFDEVENAYRVALTELAAQGGLVPQTPPPNVPQPTATTPDQAEKTEPASPKADTAEHQSGGG